MRESLFVKINKKSKKSYEIDKIPLPRNLTSRKLDLEGYLSWCNEKIWFPSYLFDLDLGMGLFVWVDPFFFPNKCCD